MSNFVVNSAYIENYGSITAYIESHVSITSSLSFPTSVTIVGEKYDGETEIIPKCEVTQILETKDKRVMADIVIHKIPTYETSNEYGYTFIIGD